MKTWPCSLQKTGSPPTHALRMPALLWPLLFVLGAAAGGVYTVPLIIVGQRFRGADLVAANASIGVIWGLGNLTGPAVAGIGMRAIGANGLPMVLTAVTVVFLAVFAWCSVRNLHSDPSPGAR